MAASIQLSHHTNVAIIQKHPTNDLHLFVGMDSVTELVKNWIRSHNHFKKSSAQGPPAKRARKENTSGEAELGLGLGEQMLFIVGGPKSGKTLVSTVMVPYLLREKFARKIRVLTLTVSELVPLEGDCEANTSPVLVCFFDAFRSRLMSFQRNETHPPSQKVPNLNTNLEEIIRSICSCLSSPRKEEWVVVLDGLENLLSRLDLERGMQFIRAVDEINETVQVVSRVQTWWLFSGSFYAAIALKILENRVPVSNQFGSGSRFRNFELAQWSPGADLKEMCLLLRHYLWFDKYLLKRVVSAGGPLGLSCADLQFILSNPLLCSWKAGPRLCRCRDLPNDSKEEAIRNAEWLMEEDRVVEEAVIHFLEQKKESLNTETLLADSHWNDRGLV
eukprot:TRINITY_DN5878_c0_g1_i1.p1 TRINITY_DN5878_c0_g1~~TRINITY_DN5878_c0_g1_i1.p1  ORF type:complete len:389 (+),score=70.93 TRINITY_DN5878_c0_g1_i1:200-1366(+)